MKNILGIQEDLKLYNKSGNLVYKFTKYSNGYSYQATVDEKGLAFKKFKWVIKRLFTRRY